MRQTDPKDMILGEEYIAEHKTNGNGGNFTFFGINDSGDVRDSNSSGFIAGHYNYFTTSDDYKWVLIPSDVPLKFRPKGEETDWYVGWFNSTQYAFYGISRGDTAVAEFFERGIEWKTL